MDSSDDSSAALCISLKEIASWTSGVCPEVQPKFRASIPALQRGLVWKPQQNELLWDSILRGFPIGAVVVTKWSDQLKKSAEATDVGTTHHLLDGQQRCHAVALGFTDPFEESEKPRPIKAETILWLDLDPEFDKNSTRNFLVRATTTAHPWGYRKDDAATPLQVWAIRQALEAVNLNAAQPDYRRPKPRDLWPCKAAAEVPVPLAWLLRLPADDEAGFWDKLAEKAAKATHLPWAAAVQNFSASPQKSSRKASIFKAIRRVHAAQMIALEAPDELLEVSEREQTQGSEREDVSNIEQLFQRLNSQGTKLDGEELAYSMIKAYWRDLEVPINEAADQRMPQARMVSLGVRAALAEEAKPKASLPGPPSVGTLRKIANTEPEKKAQIQAFIEDDLRAACDLADKWLKYDAETNQSGLLPVHLTSLAINSREVYLLVLHFAKRSVSEELPHNWKTVMQSLSSLVHWFAPEKARVANRVYEKCRSQITVENVRLALAEAIKANELHEIHAPEAADEFLTVSEKDLKDWAWWRHIAGSSTEEAAQERRRRWDGFLNFRYNREMLLYAQREFLARRFPDYNPARRDLWESHNRPWDFDHLLAHYFYYNRKDGSAFRSVCGDWGNTIGNLRAWPFEDNRSDQDDRADAKLMVHGRLCPDRLRQSFIQEKHVAGFSAGDDTRTYEAKAALFVQTTKDRLIDIYRAWYEGVEVANLLVASPIQST